ncbi:shikimate kinase [Altericista sp. CCNU0014]|uniref:shikimate kinase n=1 Tax=Altericista sp. CCNU0014 TaxID=3082949 RepID=UPI00384BF7AF
MTAVKFDLQGTNIYLIGMMGAGKSTTGRLLAQHLDYRFFDTDAAIVQAAGCSISQIFAESGESSFRQLETQTLGQLSAYKRLVVATGGGIVIERMNWSYLHHGLVVWLDASPQTLWQRLQGDAARPLLQATNPQQKLEELLLQRTPLYAQADLRIAIEAREDAETVARRILNEIPKVLKPERLAQPPARAEKRS